MIMNMITFSRTRISLFTALSCILLGSICIARVRGGDIATDVQFSQHKIISPYISSCSSSTIRDDKAVEEALNIAAFNQLSNQTAGSIEMNAFSVNMNVKEYGQEYGFSESVFGSSSLISERNLQQDLNLQQASGSESLLLEHGAYVGSMLSILVSEIGDKSFMLTAILSTKHSKGWVFAGSFSAMLLMTFISCFLGNVSEQLIPEGYLQVFASLLFFAFGAKQLHEGFSHSTMDSAAEAEEIERELSLKNKSSNGKGEIIGVKNVSIAALAFTQIFFGEWGDPSQLSTIAMSASFDFSNVFFGSITGHAMCSTLAITGGNYLAAKFSERTLTIAGGILFFVYGFGTISSFL